MGKKIVVVGAGYSGLLTAKKLAKKLKKLDDVSITIIDRNPFHTMLTELHEVAAGRVDEDSIKISLKKVFAGRKVDVKLDTVQEIDFEKKTVRGSVETYDYDFLVLAAGSKPTFFGVNGAAEYAYTLWSYDDAVRLKNHIEDCFRMASRETDLAEKNRLLTFYVVGAGFSGVEMVGELAEYLPVLCDKFEIDRDGVRVWNVDVLPRPVPNLPEKLSDKIARRLQKMHVGLMMNTGVVSIGEGFIEYKTGEKVTRATAGTVIWTAGIESSQITEEAGKTLKSARRGRIETDRYLRSVDNDSVFIVGDNILYTPEGEQSPVPQLVENCEQSSGVAANNLVCAMTGTGEMIPYRPKFHGVMVSVGGRYGVARVGTQNRQMNLPSFFAMFVKHFINVIYFIQVLGWNKVFSYLKHEFFTIRHDRSFLGGHFSNKTPSFLLFPLRVWLGLAWLFEGVMKVVEGWMTSAQLTGFFGGADSWYQNILNGGQASPDATSSATTTAAHGTVLTVMNLATQAADAVSSATVQAGDAAGQAASAVGQVLLNFNFLGLFQVIFVSGKALAQSTFSDLAFKLNVPLMNWFVDKVILPSQNVQLFMQGFIVIAEILIGLSLIGGLFTTLSSGFSLVLQVMFVCTTGLYLNTFWMIFAAIAVLIGGGRTLGLDYYAMPYLKKHWKNVGFARKYYIYHD
ncbi:NAD(P)/FAD-dependent oxidoreductase [Caproicibacter sp.]|uniref:NAD(P)/FAD-dependent oxidoreductase n=1 Tax=Caproicibacter sp. TaxID=2814884 RepID=UPI0039896B2F